MRTLRKISLGNASGKSPGNHYFSSKAKKIGSKKLMVFMLLLLGITVGQAQYFEKGDFMLGSDLGSGLVGTTSNGIFGLNVGLNDGAGFNVGISPKAGFFLNENFLLGAAINLGFAKSAETNGISAETTSYGFQGLTRFYITPGDIDFEDELPNPLRFFLENNAGFAGLNVNEGPSTFGFAFGFGPGAAYFVSDNVALEATLKYNGLLGGATDDYQNSIGLNVGVQIFLSREKAEDIIDRQIDEN